MNFYYMTWDEKKHGSTYAYIHRITAKSIKDAYNTVYRNEQTERYLQRKPHMFHVNITKKIPEDAQERRRGHLYY